MNHDLLEVRATPDDSKGLGVYAVQYIAPGSALFSEGPAINIRKPPSQITTADLDTALASLKAIQRFQFDALSAPPTHHETQNARIFFGNALSKRASVNDASASSSGLPNAISPATAESACLCLAIARLNHSCAPNAELTLHPHSGSAEVFALRGIRAGEEVCFSYLAESHCMPRSYRRFMLFLNWRFNCNCEACGADNAADSAQRDAYRERLYILRGELQNFSLPVISMKLVMRSGTDIAGTWKPGELQGLLSNLWLPPRSASVGPLTPDEQVARWRELIDLMHAEEFGGKELAENHRQLLVSLIDRNRTIVRMDGDAGQDISAGAGVRECFSAGLIAIERCRPVGHSDILDYKTACRKMIEAANLS